MKNWLHAPVMKNDRFIDGAALMMASRWSSSTSFSFWPGGVVSASCFNYSCLQLMMLVWIFILECAWFCLLFYLLLGVCVVLRVYVCELSVLVLCCDLAQVDWHQSSLVLAWHISVTGMWLTQHHWLGHVLVVSATSTEIVTNKS